MDETRAERTLRIAARFNGPPTSGNGGVVCGEIARSIPGAARIRLHAPPPLETELRIATTPEGVGLFEGERLLAEGWPTDLDLEAPPAPGFEEAREASHAFPGFDRHPFPDCFVCGPHRREGDGLRLFPGPLAGSDVCATPWIPDASLVDPARADAERIDPVFLWAALDCPGCFSFPHPEESFLLLGELSARIDGSVTAGERCVIAGWTLAETGRKHVTGTALYDSAGRLRGVASATWIEVPPTRTTA
jgi:hypothetical protein